MAELDDDELDDLAKDARLVKKLKKGKVSVALGVVSRVRKLITNV